MIFVLYDEIMYNKMHAKTLEAELLPSMQLSGIAMSRNLHFIQVRSMPLIECREILCMSYCI